MLAQLPAPLQTLLSVIVLVHVLAVGALCLYGLYSNRRAFEDFLKKNVDERDNKKKQ